MPTGRSPECECDVTNLRSAILQTYLLVRPAAPEAPKNKPPGDREIRHAAPVHVANQMASFRRIALPKDFTATPIHSRPFASICGLPSQMASFRRIALPKDFTATPIHSRPFASICGLPPKWLRFAESHFPKVSLLRHSFASICVHLRPPLFPRASADTSITATYTKLASFRTPAGTVDRGSGGGIA